MCMKTENQKVINKTINKEIEAATRRSVGFSEAADKESFLSGVNVAIFNADVLYGQEIDRLTKLVEIYEQSNEKATNDLKTLANIINRYSDND